MSERQSVEVPQPEHKEHEPKINYHFLYSAHRTAEDFSNLEEAFKKADIYVPEVVGWTMQDQEDYQAVSDGEMLPEQFGHDVAGHRLQALRVMHDSKKPILLADLHLTDEITDEYKDIRNQGERALTAFTRGEFFESLKLLRVYVERSAKLQLKRENKIKENLDKRIKWFLEENPEYSNNKELNVLIKLGSAHTTLYHKLKGEGRSVSREFKEQPEIYTFLNELVRKQLFNKTIDNELLARGIFDNFLIPNFYPITNNSNKAIWVSRKITSRLSLRDIKEISEKAGKNKGKIDIVQELETRGIKVPKTEAEMDKLVGPHKK